MIDLHHSRRVWRCPYYRFDEKHAVHCEGGSIFRIRDKGIFYKHADMYCSDAKNWEKCQIAECMTKLYEKRENHPS